MCALRLGKMQATIGHLKARAGIARQEGANGRGEGKRGKGGEKGTRKNSSVKDNSLSSEERVAFNRHCMRCCPETCMKKRNESL